MKNILHYISAITIIAIGLSSCGSSECFDNQSTLPLAGFYSMQTKKSITIDSLTVYGVGVKGDSFLLDNGQATTLYMPLPLSTNSTSYVFHYNAKALNHVELNDTLKIDYDCYPKFVSNECGVIYNYDVKDFSYTKHLIDSIAIPTMVFNNKDVEVIKIYYRTTAQK